MGISYGVRMTPANWKHPSLSWDSNGLNDGAQFDADMQFWQDAHDKWEQGLRPRFDKPETVWVPKAAEDAGDEFNDKYEKPDPENYMPRWPTEKRTHFCLYSEDGDMPCLSKPFPTREALADYAERKLGNERTERDWWLGVINKSLAEGPYAELYFAGKLGGDPQGNPLAVPGKPYRLNVSTLNLMSDSPEELRGDYFGKTGIVKLVAKLNRLADECARNESCYQFADPLRYLAQITIDHIREHVKKSKNRFDQLLNTNTFRDTIIQRAFANHPNPQIACMPQTLIKLAESVTTVALAEQAEAILMRSARA